MVWIEAEDGKRGGKESRGIGDVYKIQVKVANKAPLQLSCSCSVRVPFGCVTCLLYNSWPRMLVIVTLRVPSTSLNLKLTDLLAGFGKGPVMVCKS